MQEQRGLQVRSRLLVFAVKRVCLYLTSVYNAHWLNAVARSALQYRQLSAIGWLSKGLQKLLPRR